MSSTPTASTAYGYFGAMAETYDSLIRRAVPRYSEMTDRLLDYLPRGGSVTRDAAATPSRILELGCGTGNLTLQLAARFPAARITTVDAAPEMVELTRNRLGAAHPDSAGRATFVVSRFEEVAEGAGSFDLVTSCLSLHHVIDKSSLYKAIYRWLAPGGTLRFADLLRGSTEEIHALNWQRWQEFCREPDHCTEEEIQSLIDHAAAHDHYASLPEHFKMLTDAGFAPQSLDCVWRSLLCGVITADR